MTWTVQTGHYPTSHRFRTSCPHFDADTQSHSSPEVTLRQRWGSGGLTGGDDPSLGRGRHTAYVRVHTLTGPPRRVGMGDGPVGSGDTVAPLPRPDRTEGRDVRTGEGTSDVPLTRHSVPGPRDPTRPGPYPVPGHPSSPRVSKQRTSGTRMSVPQLSCV